MDFKSGSCPLLSLPCGMRNLPEEKVFSFGTFQEIHESSYTVDITSTEKVAKPVLTS
jgi:hypothetical protein